MKILLSTLLQLVSNDTSLRVYQFENKLKIYNEWQTCNSVMLQMPTGTGKTRLFSSIVSDIRSCTMKDGVMPSVLLIVHRKELVNQIADTLAAYGIAYGIIQSGVEEDKYCHVQVASVQTLVRRLQRWGKIRYEFVIIDEAALYIILCKRRIRDSEMSLVFSLLLILQKHKIIREELCFLC